MTSKILIEKNGPVTTIIINRPEVRNALDLEATALLAAAFDEFEHDPSAKVGVLWGAGGAFCAGADLKELAGGAAYEPWAGSADGPLRRPLNKPVIAAISGYACAGGLGVALWCDLRVAEESAMFAVLSRRWGVPMSDGTTVRLPRLIGMSNALDMLLTARKVDAAKAEQMGLVNRVVPDGQSRAAAEELALVLAGFPQIAMLSDRQSAYEQEALSLDAAIEREAELSIQARLTEAESGARRFASGLGRHGEPS
ncbi:crotonase/enoyl-CoA hydratase family protein [Alcaligenaceae bacterium]|nr:crotonase/enoyl-CoA hydratase family protein [Alcaligenaceae bacterium]